MSRVIAWLHGFVEFRLDCTTHYGGDLIEAYDSGRDFAHRVTFRLFDGERGR